MLSRYIISFCEIESSAILIMIRQKRPQVPNVQMEDFLAMCSVRIKITVQFCDIILACNGFRWWSQLTQGNSRPASECTLGFGLYDIISPFLAQYFFFLENLIVTIQIPT